MQGHHTYPNWVQWETPNFVLFFWFETGCIGVDGPHLKPWLESQCCQPEKRKVDPGEWQRDVLQLIVLCIFLVVMEYYTHLEKELDYGIVKLGWVIAQLQEVFSTSLYGVK